MESVGVRELKDRLSYYLRAVQQGGSVVVTVRGKPVARLVPVSPRGKAGLSPELEEQMYKHARNLEFEEAAGVRDQIRHLKEIGLVA